MMGSQSFERIYTLKEVQDVGNRKIAVVEMDAVPSTEMAEELHKQQEIAGLSRMFDNKGTLQGALKLDLNSGKVRDCHEKLRTEWLVVDPAAGQKPDEEPAAVRMIATRLYQLEQID